MSVWSPKLEPKSRHSPRTGKRHFPTLNNIGSASLYKTNARRYLPHGCSEDYLLRVPVSVQSTAPHDRSQQFNPERNTAVISRTETSECRRVVCDTRFLKRTPSTIVLHSGDQRYLSKDELGPVPVSAVRGLKYLLERRNNFGLATAAGDKSYHSVEYSPEFHKNGTSLPLVLFGKQEKQLAPLFVPHVPPRPLSVSYGKKEQQRQLAEDARTVECLESWRPATPLAPPPSAGPLPIKRKISNIVATY